MGFSLLSKFLTLKSLVSDSLVSGESSEPAESAPAPKTGWQKFIDGLNAAGRPILLLGISALFVLAYVDPTGFSAFAAALASLPEMAWYSIFTVVLTYMGARGMVDVRNSGRSTTYTAPTGLDTPTEEPVVSQGRFDNLDHDDDVLSTPKSTPNASIEAWKAQNAQN